MLQRRAFSPMEVAGLILWLRPEELRGYAHGADVSRWQDASGRGNHATGAANLPTADRTRPWGRGFGASVLFNGTDDRLDLPNITTTSPSTLLAVVRSVSTHGDARGLLVAHGPGWYTSIDASSDWGMYLNAPVESGQVLNRSTPYVLSSVVRAVNDLDLVTDGSKVNKTDGISYATRGATRLGADPTGVQFLDAAVCELLWYDRALSLSERKPIEEYLHRRFSEPVVGVLGAA